MFLEKFADCETIYIQCHDSPDADALGSGYGLYSYFRHWGKDVHLIYSGSNRITKPGLRLMIEHLDIPVEYREELPACDVLITVDCQYKGGNITPFAAGRIAMVDHHPCCVAVDEWCCIQSEYGSCCTVVWELLQEAGFDVNADRKLATALYYGLYSDTGQLSEIYHPMDRNMRDTLEIDRGVLELMVNSNLSRYELEIAGEALSNYYYNNEFHFAVLHAKPCDPNLLGVISDLVIQVDTIDACVVYSATPIGYKLSIRSSIRPVEASRLASQITEDIGSGGGHINKAGGFVHRKMFCRKYPERGFEEVLCERIREYLFEAMK